MNIKQIKPNTNNPRIIKGDKFKKLVQSIKDFPEMLELRPIVIDENNIVLGGNMRLRACIEAGLTEVPVTMAKDLTEDQKKEFIVKDNVGFGEWDWDILANEWDADELEDWGLDVWTDKEPQLPQATNNITLKFSDEDYEFVTDRLLTLDGSTEEVIIELLKDE